jgi:hypothetical protein
VASIGRWRRASTRREWPGGFIRACGACCDAMRTRRRFRPTRRGAGGAAGRRRGQGPARSGGKRGTGQRKLQGAWGAGCLRDMGSRDVRSVGPRHRCRAGRHAARGRVGALERVHYVVAQHRPRVFHLPLFDALNLQKFQ